MARDDKAVPEVERLSPEQLEASGIDELGHPEQTGFFVHGDEGDVRSVLLFDDEDAAEEDAEAREEFLADGSSPVSGVPYEEFADWEIDTDGELERIDLDYDEPEVVSAVILAATSSACALRSRRRQRGGFEPRRDRSSHAQDQRCSSGRNGRSGSSQSTSSSWSGASQRTRSCSTGSGSPVTRSATATLSSYAVADRRGAGEPASYDDHDAELLGDLAHQGGLRRLAVLDLAARELPPPGGRRGAGAAGGEHTPVAHQRRAHHLLHAETLRSGHAVRRGGAPRPDRREHRRDRRAGHDARRPGRARRGARRLRPQGPQDLAAGAGGAPGLHVRPRRPAGPALVAAGRDHVGGCLGRGGDRRPSDRGRRVVRQGAARRRGQAGLADHVLRPRVPALPARAAGGAGPEGRPRRHRAADRARRRDRLVRRPTCTSRRPRGASSPAASTTCSGWTTTRSRRTATATCCRCGSPTRPRPTRATSGCATRSCRSTRGPRRRRSWPVSTAAETSATRRLARFAIEPESLLLATTEDGVTRPSMLDEGVGQMQGAVVARGRYHVTVSKGPWTSGPSTRARRARSGGTDGRRRWGRRTSPTGPPPTCCGR